MTLRTIVLPSVLPSVLWACALGSACSPDAPAPTKPATAEAKAPELDTKVDTKTPPMPIDDPHVLPAPGKDPKPPPIVASAAGKFDVVVEGQAAHLMRLPPGQNRAVWVPETGLARVSLAASDPDTGMPHLRLLIEGVRPDQAQYPVKITGRTKDTKDAATPSLTVRYQVSDKRLYVIDPAKEANIELTLEGYEGSTLRGRFSGALAPTAAGLGAPIPISGEFAVELGLQGVKPSPSPTPTPTPTEAQPPL